MAADEQFDLDTRRAIRAAIARDDYARGRVRIADPDLTGYDWLVATNRGLFAVNDAGTKFVVHGWFFGIHRNGNTLYLFENCALRDRASPLGRLLRLRIDDQQLVEPVVLTTGLDANCHQVAMIDGALCVVDTENQAIRRFTPEGDPIDTKRPFPPADRSDTSGAYLHINSIANVGDRVAVMLHNGRAVPDRPSELAWLDADWREVARTPLAGYDCHDIVADEAGVLWHSGSRAGEIIASDGRVVKITDRLMTRGLAIRGDRWMVGVTSFGPRQARDYLDGGVVILDRAFGVVAEHDIAGCPADCVAL